MSSILIQYINGYHRDPIPPLVQGQGTSLENFTPPGGHSGGEWGRVGESGREWERVGESGREWGRVGETKSKGTKFFK